MARTSAKNGAKIQSARRRIGMTAAQAQRRSRRSWRLWMERGDSGTSRLSYAPTVTASQATATRLAPAAPRWQDFRALIIGRSPLRVSLGGGGTDLPSYYREHGGFLIAAAMTKYVYVSMHET